MKTACTLLTALCIMQTAFSQVYISSGATLHLAGNAQVTLQDVNFVNDGTLSAPANGRIIFSGNGDNEIAGTDVPAFAELEIAKTGTGFLTLQTNIGVSNKIVFTSNLIDLNNNNIDLGGTGILENENENSRVTGASGGQIICTANLNATSVVNPANLGAVITSAQDLGNTEIRRGHQSQTNGGGGGNSILRYFDISPTNNTTLNATLRMYYFDAELNGLLENTMDMFESPDNSNWQNLGYLNRDATANFLEQTAIPDFARFTMSNTGNALPLVWGVGNISCDGNEVLIRWQTLYESNTASFTIQRSSMGGSQWTTVATVAATGNSQVPVDYSINDTEPGNFYRILQTDLDGRTSISPVLRSNCTNKELFSAYPNPVSSRVTIEAYASSNQPVAINIFDAKGVAVKQLKKNLNRGMNQLQIDVNGLPNGSYWLQVKWVNGTEKVIRIEKQ